MTITSQASATGKKPRNWSRQTKFKIRRTHLTKAPTTRKGITRARVNRIVRQQNAQFKKGDFRTKMYTEGLDQVTRISQCASEVSAQIMERFLMDVLKDACAAAAHAGRVTIKKTDLQLALRCFKRSG